MAIDLEVKHRLQAIEARLKALEDRPQSIVTQETLVDLAKLEALNRPEQPKKNMCPKCGVKPAYFFHVRSCKG
jgi:hypothetical protein